jgi:hypothetical protein
MISSMGFSRLTALGGYLFAVMMVAGCAAELSYPLYSPQEMAGSYGYGEQRLSRDHYKVTYLAPARTIYSYDDHGRKQATASRLALAYDMALWRAAELALANGYPALAVSHRDNDVRVNIGYDYYDDAYGHFPYYHRRSHRHFGYLPLHRFGYHDRYANLTARVSITVAFGKASDGDGMDAKAVVERLRAKYPGAAGIASPRS